MPQPRPARSKTPKKRDEGRKESGKSGKKAASVRESQAGSERKVAPPSLEERRVVVKRLGQQVLAEEKTSGTLIKVDVDAKGVPTVGQAVAERGMAREYARTLLGSKPYRAILVTDVSTVTVAANTAMSVSTPANYVAAPEFSTFAALFDEVRCLGYKARLVVGIGSSAQPTAGTCWAGAIDAALNTAPSSLIVALEHTRHCGPVPATPLLSSGAGVYSGPSVAPVSNHGTVELVSGPLMRGVTTNNSGGTMTVNPVQGNWVPIGTNSAHAGYVLLYGDQPGAGVSWTYRQFIWYSLEFRARA